MDDCNLPNLFFFKHSSSIKMALYQGQRDLFSFYKKRIARRNPFQ